MTDPRSASTEAVAAAAGDQPGERGFALLVVMWTLGVLGLLVAGLAASGRLQIGLANGVRGSAMAEAAADGAVQRAIFQLHAGVWAADGLPRRVAIGRSVVEVSIEDQSGRINPNFCSTPLLAALLDMAGVAPPQALDLARRIVDWRTATQYAVDGGLKLDRYHQAGLPYGPPDRPFASVDEIGLVAGMTTDLLDRLRPYLSVYQSGDPGLAAATGRSAVQDAEMINHAAVLIGFTSPYRVVRIRASAMLANRTRFVRTAVVRLPVQPARGKPAWQILTWG